MPPLTFADRADDFDLDGAAVDLGGQTGGVGWTGEIHPDPVAIADARNAHPGHFGQGPEVRA
jgi:hypothetical protein